MKKYRFFPEDYFDREGIRLLNLLWAAEQTENEYVRFCGPGDYDRDDSRSRAALKIAREHFGMPDGHLHSMTKFLEASEDAVWEYFNETER